MRFMAGQFILSTCLNSVGNLVRSGVGKLSDGAFVSHLCFVKLIPRAIYTDVYGVHRNFCSKEKSEENVNWLGIPEDNEGSSGDVNMPVFVKLNDSDVLISKVMMSVMSKKSQKNGNEILLEGSRLIADAIKFGAVPKMVFFSRKEDVIKIRWPKKNFQLYKVAYKTIKTWSSLTSSPGILGIFKKPQISMRETDERTVPLLIVCDNIRDPGNLGSILRIAAGVGCKSVFLTKGCVELWEPKVLRSGAGAHFVLPVQSNCTWDSISTNYLDEYSTIVLADNSSSSMDSESRPILIRNDIPLEKYLMVDYSGAWDDGGDVVLVLGGETTGLSPEACELALSRGGIRLNIPLCNEIESLNAGTALGIITFEIRRQYDEWLQRNKSLSSKSSELLEN